jgi:polysaccharide export outer membrane protein
MKNKILLLFLLLVSVLSSCVTPRDTNLIQESVRKDYADDASLKNDYRIIPGDRLMLIVYTLDEDMRTLFAAYSQNSAGTGGGGGSGVNTSVNIVDQKQSNILNVYSDGTVKIPYLGRISVLDMTVMDAKKAIEAQFAQFSPEITIELSLQNRYFSLLGAISESRVPMPSPRINIYQALALGGIIDPFGDRRKVRVVRQTPNGTQVNEFDIRSKDIINSEYYYIQPNDVIYVQELSRTFFGRITSFTGLVGGFGTLMTAVGTALLIVNLTK